MVLHIFELLIYSHLIPPIEESVFVIVEFPSQLDVPPVQVQPVTFSQPLCPTKSYRLHPGYHSLKTVSILPETGSWQALPL